MLEIRIRGADHAAKLDAIAAALAAVNAAHRDDMGSDFLAAMADAAAAIARATLARPAERPPGNLLDGGNRRG